jgi:hypothetical protein
LCVLPSVSMLIATDAFGFCSLLPYSAMSISQKVRVFLHLCGFTNAYQPTSRLITCLVSPNCILKVWFIHLQYRMLPCVRYWMFRWSYTVGCWTSNKCCITVSRRLARLSCGPSPCPCPRLYPFS